jgi:hypothetical protein
MITSPRLFALPAIAAMMLTACGSPDDSPGAGGMTEGENERLEEAADRLDARAPSPGQDPAAALEAEVADGIAREGQQQQAQ